MADNNPLGFLDGQTGEDITKPKVELRIEGYKLSDLDVASKSDPFAVLYMKVEGKKGWQEVGRTETIMNNANPKFIKAFELLYTFEKQQDIRIEFFDRDMASEKLTNHDYIGSAETTLAQVVTSPGQSLIMSLKNEFHKRRRAGFVKFVVEQTARKKKDIFIDVGLKLPKKDSKNRFFTISRAREDGTWQPVYKSEMARLLDGNGRFKSVSITGQVLNGGDDNRPLKFQVFEEKGSSEKLVSEAQTSYAALKLMKAGAEIELRAALENKGKGGGLFTLCIPTGAAVGEVAGYLVVYSCREVKEPTFLDFVLGGCEISVVLGIDFTSSNGDPRKPGTLHYIMDSNVQNEYEIAVRSVCGILLQYAADERMPAYGFGARLPPNWETSHCFPVSGDPSKPYVEGIEGLLETYKQALHHIQLYGPTNFAEIIRTAATFASGVITQNEQRYVILLILTDGVVSDMKQTIAEIVNASNLPFSVIIIGVGGEDFSSMKILDADEKRLRFGDRVAARDIVQFVPFRQFNNDPILLAREVLQE